MCFGQKHQIKIKIDNPKEKVFYLYTYHATNDKVLPVDTASLDMKNRIVFEGKKPLSRGMYVLTDTANRKITDFLIGDEQVFQMELDQNNPVESIKTSHTKDNQVFFDFIKYNGKVKSELSAEQKKDPKALREANIKIKDYQKKLTEENKDLFVGKFFRATQEVPNPYTQPKDSIANYYYYKKHYWDNLDLSDTGFLHTPILKPKMNFYFNKVVQQIPDTIIAAIDHVIEQTPAKSDMRDYMLYDLIGEYQNHQYMGFDKVFIHLSDQYFLNDKMKNFPESSRKLLEEAVEKTRPTLLGETGQNMVLVDTTGNLIPLYSIKQPYTVIFFYDYDCSHCKKDLEKLYKLYSDGLKDHAQVYSVCTNPDLDKWKDFVKEHHYPWINVNGTHTALGNFNELYNVDSTPLIYVLDAQHKIIGKKIAPEQVKQIIDKKLKDGDN